MDIIKYKQKQIIIDEPISFVSNYTTKISIISSKKITIPNSIKNIIYCEHFLRRLSDFLHIIICPNNVKYLYVSYSTKYINYSKKYIYIMENGINSLSLKKFRKHNVLHTTFIYKIYASMRYDGVGKKNNIFLLENNCNICVNIPDKTKNRYPLKNFKNIIFSDKCDNINTKNLFLFKNIKCIEFETINGLKFNMSNVNSVTISKYSFQNIDDTIMVSFKNAKKIKYWNHEYDIENSCEQFYKINMEQLKNVSIIELYVYRSELNLNLNLSKNTNVLIIAKNM